MCSRSSSAVVGYHRSSIASSLPGAQSRLIARTATTRDHGMSAGASSRRAAKNASSRSWCQSAQPEQCGPQLPRPLQPHPLDQHLGHLRIVGWRGDLRWKQFQLMPFAGLVEDLDRLQPPRLRRVIQLAEMAERPLAWPIGGADRFNQRPIRVPLAILIPMMRTRRNMRRDGRTHDRPSQEGRSALHGEFRIRSLRLNELQG